MAFVTIRIKGAEGYTRVPLGKARMVAGRASACDLPIKHTSISREHCAFVREGDAWFAEDLGSSNGTWVNKDKVTGRTRLQAKDIVKIGSARLTFHADDIADHPAAAAVEIDGDDGEPSPGETRARGTDDPPEAIACEACAAWFSVAHRMAGDTMACPRCGQQIKVPALQS